MNGGDVIAQIKSRDGQTGLTRGWMAEIVSREENMWK